LKLSQKEAAETAQESLERNSTVFIEEHHGKLAGFTRVQFWDGAYSIREVFVVRPFRSRGVGGKLLASYEDLVREKGETSVYLTVEPKHQVSLKYLIRNGYDTLNMLELRKDLAEADFPERQGDVKILGNKLRLLKRNL